jgi:uncharacterized protein (TIGR02145 family)
VQIYNKQYKTVEIGTQIWMAENLNYDTANKKCYENFQGNCDIFGGLYSWTDAKNACPNEWNLPNDDDWKALKEYIEIEKGCTNCAGKYLKTIDDWDYKGTYNGTDDYGFAALPGGKYEYNDSPSELDEKGYWWSATFQNEQNNPTSTWRIDNDDDRIWTSNYNSSRYLFSIRCIKGN